MAGTELVRPPREMEGFKQPATMDEILEHKLAPVIEAINEHVEKIYQDFNMALSRQINSMNHVEHSLTQMVQVLWGIVNKANARTAALERVLIENGLDAKQLEDEILKVEDELESTGEWKSLGLDDIAQNLGLDFSHGDEGPRQ